MVASRIVETIYYLLHQCQASLADSGITPGHFGLALLGAVATLGGAWVGAERGAKGAYRASVKSNYDLMRRNKQEEAITELQRLRHDEFVRMVKVHAELGRNGPVSAYMLASEEKIDLSFATNFPLITTIEIYFEDGYEAADQLWDAMLEFGIFVHSLAGVDSEDREVYRKADQLLKQFSDSRNSLLEQLKAALKENP